MLWCSLVKGMFRVQSAVLALTYQANLLLWAAGKCEVLFPPFHKWRNWDTSSWMGFCYCMDLGCKVFKNYRLIWEWNIRRVHVQVCVCYLLSTIKCLLPSSGISTMSEGCLLFWPSPQQCPLTVHTQQLYFLSSCCCWTPSPSALQDKPGKQWLFLLGGYVISLMCVCGSLFCFSIHCSTKPASHRVMINSLPNLVLADLLLFSNLCSSRLKGHLSRTSCPLQPWVSAH